MEDKASILDVRAKEVGGGYFNIEVQVARQTSYKERTVFYGSTMISEQPIAGKKYASLIPCVHISLVDFILFPEHDDFASKFFLYDVEHKIRLTDLIEYHYIELSKFRCSKLEELGSSLQRWMYFLRNATEYQDYDELPEQLRQEEGMIMAYQATHEALCDQELIYELQARRKFLLDQSSNLHAAREEGIAQGRSNTIRLAARPMQEQGLSMQAIAAVFTLSEAELVKILSEDESNESG